MKNPNGPYPGRQLFIGMTPVGRPCLAYLVTGRSPESRQRKAVEMGNKIVVGPLGAAAYDPLRHYTALQYDNQSGVCAITNGIQTEAVFETYRLLYNVKTAPTKDYLAMLMEGANYEPDSLKTPRIGGVISRTLDGRPFGAISLKRHDGPVHTWEVDFKSGTLTGVSTYAGDLENPLPFDPSRGLPQLKTVANEAGELARFLFDISVAANKGQDIRVLTLGAVWSGMAWEVAVKNAV